MAEAVSLGLQFLLAHLLMKASGTKGCDTPKEPVGPAVSELAVSGGHWLPHQYQARALQLGYGASCSLKPTHA